MTYIKKHRISAGYTQRYVAAYLHVTQSAYQNYEQGRRLPDIFILLRLAKLYNVNVTDLISVPNDLA